MGQSVQRPDEPGAQEEQETEEEEGHGYRGHCSMNSGMCPSHNSPMITVRSSPRSLRPTTTHLITLLNPPHRLYADYVTLYT